MTKIILRSAVKFTTGIIVSLLCSAATAQENLTINLDQAFNMALERNESYQIARRESDRAHARIIEALSSALPQITGNVSYVRNWEIPTGVFQMGDETVTFKFGTKNSLTADLTLNQTLYSGGRTFTAIKVAGLARKLVRQTIRQTGQDLKEQVYNGFYGAMLAQNVLRVNEESQRLAEDNLNVVQKMYDQGVSAEFDLLRARVAVANLQPQVIKARNDSELALNALKNLLGIDLNTNLNLAASSDSNQFVLPPIDVASAREELRKNRPEIAMSDLNVAINKQLISLAQAGYRPMLAFSTALQYQRLYDRGGPFDTRWNRSITSAVVFSMPIFDSWKTPSQVRQARIDYAQSKLRDQAVVKGMMLDFEQSLGRYLEARNRLSAQGDAVELARRGLDIANVRFESGVGTQLEVADARLSLSMAEINKAVAFHDLAVSYAAVLKALGREINP